MADESVEYQIVERLRQDGHEVLYVAEMEPGILDDAVLDLANREEVPLLTTDMDFGELVFRQHRSHSGVVLLRLSGLSTQAKVATAAVAINERIAEYPGAFAVVTPSVVRFRRPHRQAPPDTS